MSGANEKPVSGPKNPALFEQAKETLDGQADRAAGNCVRLTTEITLRDLFAAAVVGGMYASGQAWIDQAVAAKAGDAEAFAHWAYETADAMLRERAKAEGSR